MFSWVTALPVAGLLLAAVPRLWSHSTRPTGLTLLALSVVLSADAASDVVSDRVVARLCTLLSVLATTAAATGALALARRIGQPRQIVVRRPIPVGMLVVLAQVTLWARAANLEADTRPFARSHEMIVLSLVTVGWAATATAALSAVLWAVVPGVQRPTIRAAAAAAMVAGVLLGVYGAAELVAAATPLPDIWVTDLAALRAVAATLLACGLLAPRVTDVLQPCAAWLAAMVACRRLRWLAVQLQAAVPDWRPAADPELPSWQHPQEQLYLLVVGIRDVTWTLLGRVDDTLVAAALLFATEHRAHEGERAVAAAAEACWLSAAADNLGTKRGSSATGLWVGWRSLDDQLGSLRDEVPFLVAVSRIWRKSALVEDFRRVHFSPAAAALVDAR